MCLNLTSEIESVLKEEIESFSNTILFDVKYLNSASKIKAILVLYGPKFNKMKVKLIIYDFNILNYKIIELN